MSTTKSRKHKLPTAKRLFTNVSHLQAILNLLTSKSQNIILDICHMSKTYIIVCWPLHMRIYLTIKHFNELNKSSEQKPIPHCHMLKITPILTRIHVTNNVNINIKIKRPMMNHALHIHYPTAELRPQPETKCWIQYNLPVHHSYAKVKQIKPVTCQMIHDVCDHVPNQHQISS